MDKMGQDEELIPIGEVATTLGLTTRTLRYWEEMGLIKSYQRPEGGSRVYTPYMVRRIKFIMKLKALGLTIKELQDLGEAYGDARRTENMIPRLIGMLDIHINKVDEKIGELSSLRREIVDYRQKMTDKASMTRQEVIFYIALTAAYHVKRPLSQEGGLFASVLYAGSDDNYVHSELSHRTGGRTCAARHPCQSVLFRRRLENLPISGYTS